MKRKRSENFAFFTIHNMKHHEIFDTVSFPVFAADENECILYKNSSALRHIGTMRKGAHITRYLLTDTIPPSGSIAHIKTETPYPNALVLSDEKESLFLCFSRLQYPDYEKAAEQILSIFGCTRSAFCEVFAQHTANIQKEKAFPHRLSADCLRMQPSETDVGRKNYPLGSLVSELFSKTESAFGAFGYRIQTEISPSFAQKHPVNINPCDWIFLFGRILHGIMKLSEDGKIQISLSSDSIRSAHILQFYTRTRYTSCEERPALALLTEAAPETSLEWFLISQMDKNTQSISARFAALGGLYLEYEIPYLASMLTVHSTVFLEEYSHFLDAHFSRICGILTETSFDF